MESIIVTSKMVNFSKLNHPVRLSDTSRERATGQQNCGGGAGGVNQILIPT